MPRTLPWLTGGGQPPKGSTPQRRKIKTPDRNEDNEETPKGKAASINKAQQEKDIFKSSSPPTSPVHHPCPSEEFLIEGLDHDDIYMMVEDEFYSVAQTFTQHLHYAEYVRRSKEAKLQNAAAIQNMERPTDGVTPTSVDAQQRKAASALQERQKEGLNQMANRPCVDSDDENDEELEIDEHDSWAGTSLHDLMMSPRKIRSLVGMQGIKSSTRAAAGYVQTSSPTRSSTALPSSPSSRQGRQHDVDETASEDDDLDIETNSAPKRSLQNARVPSKSASTTSRTDSRTNTPTEDPKGKGKASTGTKYRSEDGSKIRLKKFFDDFDGLPEPKKSNDSMQRREASTTASKTSRKGSRSENPDSKKRRLNEVPTFLL